MTTPLITISPDRAPRGEAGGGETNESLPDRTREEEIEATARNPDFKIEIKPVSDADDVPMVADTPIPTPKDDKFCDSATNEPDPTSPQETENADQTRLHESGSFSAEDLTDNLAVVPEIPISTTEEVKIEDLQVGKPGSATPEEIEKLRHIIWQKRHLLIGTSSGGQGCHMRYRHWRCKPIAQ
ncbi:hypothetical protein P3T76_007430 [Phytophthora citrophthora]|uniref:Reverse transcriptase n=1 Tax=Phytophthora citrophthora TaxID=4793 RepID=A0AAD9GMH3_9STRA|nr:hypothetical protein P3T76_007430 [Phytophthora citrophthora]